MNKFFKGYKSIKLFPKVHYTFFFLESLFFLRLGTVKQGRAEGRRRTVESLGGLTEKSQKSGKWALETSVGVSPGLAATAHYSPGCLSPRILSVQEMCACGGGRWGRERHGHAPGR